MEQAYENGPVRHVEKRMYALPVYGVLILIACLTCTTTTGRASSATCRLYPGDGILVRAENPDPSRLPQLSLWTNGKWGGAQRALVSSEFPGPAGLVCDAWCYESPLDFLGGKSLSGGRLELRHRSRTDPALQVVTIVIPEEGAVEFLAHCEPDLSGNTLAQDLPVLNLCWQMIRAPGFSSKPDPYPEFVKRCFLFTQKGRTFLDQTQRRSIARFSDDHPRNNPPWIQRYVAAWGESSNEGAAWAPVSPDRYTARIIGVISRDGSYLAALASDSAPEFSQAWLDCIHGNPLWHPLTAKSAQRTWRLKIYLMKNDLDVLLRKVREDFPQAVVGSQR